MYVLNWLKQKTQIDKTDVFGEKTYHAIPRSFGLFSPKSSNRNNHYGLSINFKWLFRKLWPWSLIYCNQILLLYSNCFLNHLHYRLLWAQKIMLSKSNSNIPVNSRQRPTCARCRNHGIYFVQLKDHSNLCPYKHCSCEHCGLILERKRLTVKPGRQTKVIDEKPRKRKKRPSNMTQKGEDVNTSKALIDPKMADAVPTSCLSGKGKVFKSCVRNAVEALPFSDQDHLFGGKNKNEQEWLFFVTMKQ